MSFAKDMLSWECVENSQDFTSYSGIIDKDFLVCLSTACLMTLLMCPVPAAALCSKGQHFFLLQSAFRQRCSQ